MMDDYASVVDPKLNAELEERNVKWRFIVEASRSNQPHDLPAQLIVNKAKSIDTCKALIVARSNKSKLAEFFVGSVTSEVIKRSQVPVLVFNE